MSDAQVAESGPADPNDDCPLPVSVQNWNIACFASYFAIVYLVAPVSYVGLTHANLLRNLGNGDDISNLPGAMYLWMTFIPVVVSWMFPHPRYLKPLAMLSVGVLALSTAAVAAVLGSDTSPTTRTVVVIAHGALFGAANGFLFTAIWDVMRRGVSTSRRGKALGFSFGIGPLFACIGSVLQDACFDGKLLGGWTFGLTFPNNYRAMFAATAPLFLLEGLILVLSVVPTPSIRDEPQVKPLQEIGRGLLQFVRNRNVLLAVVIYVIVYSGGNTILSNVSLYARNVMGEGADTVGQQNFLRFGFKAVAGALLGVLLAKVNPRATLLATTSILLAGMGWALISGGWGWPFMMTFGLLGAGELFGAYFPNYVTTASAKKYVRINMAYLGVLSALTGFSAYGFGMISKHFGKIYSERYSKIYGEIEGHLLGEMQGRIISIYVAAAILVIGLALILLLLPVNPTPREQEGEASSG